MHDPDKKMIQELESIISNSIYLYYSEHFKDGCETGLVLNLTISAHISSLVNMMRDIAEDSTGNDIKKKVDSFVEKLLLFISQTFKMDIDIVKRE